MATPSTTRKTGTTVRNKPSTTTTAADATDTVTDAETGADTNAAGPERPRALRKPELVNRVVMATGMKKKVVKPVVEAMLAELGAAMSGGEQLNLQPFGKMRVTRQKDLANGEVLVAKLRRSTQSIDETADLPTTEPVSETPLATPAE